MHGDHEKAFEANCIDYIDKMIKDSRTEDGQRKLSENVFESLENNGMLCLSKNPASTLMWSYYASGHEGNGSRSRNKTH